MGTGLAARCLSDDAGALIPLVATILTRPDLPVASLTKLREKIVAEIQSEEDDAPTLAEQRFSVECYGHAFLKHPKQRSRLDLVGYHPTQV